MIKNNCEPGPFNLEQMENRDMNDEEDRAYLIAAIVWQESLLQSYRSLHLTIQSILLAVGVGLSVVPLTTSNYPNYSIPVLVSAFLLSCMAGLHRYSTNKFSSVIWARGEDINWWHAEMIRKEQYIPPASRYFTSFKIHQQARRKDVSHLESMFLSASPTTLADSQIEELIEKGIGHTRKVIDQQLFMWISRIWWILLFVTWAGPVTAYFVFLIGSHGI